MADHDEKPDGTVRTAGKLRAVTAHARAVDAVKVFVYLPGQRGPVECLIAAWSLKPLSADAPNTLNLFARPAPEPDEPQPPDGGPGDVPTPTDEEPPDRGVAGRITEKVPNKEDLVRT